MLVPKPIKVGELKNNYKLEITGMSESDTDKKKKSGCKWYYIVGALACCLCVRGGAAVGLPGFGFLAEIFGDTNGGSGGDGGGSGGGGGGYGGGGGGGGYGGY